MAPDEALKRLRYCRPVSCRVPDDGRGGQLGLEFTIESKDAHGLIWYRTRPRRPGGLNNYCRLSDYQMLNWLESLELLGVAT